jgi:hypothetical protein
MNTKLGVFRVCVDTSGVSAEGGRMLALNANLPQFQEQGNST